MDYKQLIELLGENSEAVNFVKTIETNATNNIETINNLERSVGEIKQTRDKYKDGNSLVKSLLGLEQINEETLSGFLNSKGGKGDDKLTAEVENLKKLLEEANGNIANVTSGYEGKLQKMALDNAIAGSGVGATFANEAMYKLGIDLIKDGAVYEDGKIIYKNADGTTAYNGSTPMSISDKLNGLKADANYAGLFKPDGNGGSGTPPSSSGGTINTVGLSPTEMMKQGRK